MDFPFDLNGLFPERISMLDQNLYAGRKTHGRLDAQNQTAMVIDELGKASAKYLGPKMSTSSQLSITVSFPPFVLIRGRGVAVGYLKVGYKKLFLLDQQGAHVETEPQCVLDFYVTESMQRHGYGLELFHFMLEHKKVKPEQMAYDRPSSKFLAFLEKHFGLKHSVPQVNNFVVFDGFFRYKSAVQLRKVQPKKPEGEIKPYSLMEREAVRVEQKARPWPFVCPTATPPSPPVGISSQFSRSLSVGSSPSRTPPCPAPIPGPRRGITTRPQLSDSCRAKRTSNQGLVARNHLYSRHMTSRGFGLLLAEQLSTSKLPGLQPVVSVKECDTGRQADALEHTNTAESTLLPQSQAASLPALCSSRSTRRQQTPRAAPGPEEEAADLHSASLRGGKEPSWPEAARDTKGAKMAVEAKRAPRGSGWSWTVGERRYTAQWVRQKQENRSTCPW
ncbi:hypothetical protein P4O66_019276 [Electrophorus voltai]|uniref:Alpha-tubulin N-acetyltransferase 1 n=1 Tax=Electrophorus voltai TaxID=2609070 RepID=A0AAD8ZV63_9TELE|nr:hypothetical protein P4O66_019276 [Electrophorus voltai]